ncbi:unnamed protein product [Owenia fusiformis]|uniref:Uncharacterized protein n=1 Tax=Owenia fusiformis TaxID=6347 RepID=A0A8J1T6Z3_OWEFU|nr:unnamed protein product [Owenia fusiformis]
MRMLAKVGKPFQIHYNKMTAVETQSTAFMKPDQPSTSLPDELETTLQQNLIRFCQDNITFNMRVLMVGSIVFSVDTTESFKVDIKEHVYQQGNQVNGDDDACKTLEELAKQWYGGTPQEEIIDPVKNFKPVSESVASLPDVTCIKTELPVSTNNEAEDDRHQLDYIDDDAKDADYVPAPDVDHSDEDDDDDDGGDEDEDENGDEKPKVKKGRKKGSKQHACELCDYSTHHINKYTEHMNRHNGVRPHHCDKCDKTFVRETCLKRHIATHKPSIKCNHCDEVFKKAVKLKKHIKKEHPDEVPPMTCDFCFDVFVTLSEYEEHMELEHNHICSDCGDTFTSKSLLNKHANIHKYTQTKGGTFSCEICNKVCPTIGAMRKHNKRHKQRMSGLKFNCNQCNKNFSSESAVYHHKRGVHGGEKPFKCEICDATFSFHHSMKLHRLKHEGKRPFACDICDKTYLTAHHLKCHKQGAHENHQYQCSLCPKSFGYLNSFKMHVAGHSKQERTFICDQCGKGFLNKTGLINHEGTHITVKAYKCSHCDKMYKTETLRKLHERRHTTDASRYICDICGLTFMYKSSLASHTNVHNEDRKFECAICKASFKSPASLYTHKLVHQTDTPFKCTQCGKGFKSKDRVIQHEKRHLGLKPHQCNLCNRAFPDKGGLSKHTKTVHLVKRRFICPICGKSCARADNLRVHMKTHGENGKNMKFIVKFENSDAEHLVDQKTSTKSGHRTSFPLNAPDTSNQQEMVDMTMRPLHAQHIQDIKPQEGEDNKNIGEVQQNNHALDLAAHPISEHGQGSDNVGPPQGHPEGQPFNPAYLEAANSMVFMQYGYMHGFQ